MVFSFANIPRCATRRGGVPDGGSDRPATGPGWAVGRGIAMMLGL
ncbi:hypothetical protein I549_4230 [Mycobacterium avium subsp. avium 2285 (R)]|uniref:Uncharacterized protein n=1 Tax=Mycobacterium avium (strain 104) TaxID=243243 RepID=A0A0H2ZWS9_MYCA1|nr:hypothetical protein MAV_2155 [Mycobacterium avium 104]EUA38603.1 hypothetical protein I549_4230 [Mycobacterium avium subsp. avium 2285 (R)]